MASWFQIKTDVGNYTRQLQRLSREAFPQAILYSERRRNVCKLI